MFGLFKTAPAPPAYNEQTLKDTANRFADQRDYSVFMALELYKTLLSHPDAHKKFASFSPRAFFIENESRIKEFIRATMEKPVCGEGFAQSLDRIFAEKKSEIRPSEKVPCDEKSIRLIMPAFETLYLSLSNNGLSEEQREGIVRARNQLQTSIQALGGELITPSAADKFNPSEHEAIQVIHHETFPKGSIVGTQRPGVKTSQKLISAALVIVTE